MVLKDLSRQTPFIEAYHKDGKQRPSSIIIRSSSTTSDSGAALAIANLWHKTSSPLDPCHYIVDESRVYQCVPDKVAVGYNNDHTKNALSIMVCSELVDSLAAWRQPGRKEALDRAADLVARLAYFYNIPLVYLNSDSKSSRWRRRKGILVEVRGRWPKDEFLANVKNKTSEIKSAR